VQSHRLEKGSRSKSTGLAPAKFKEDVGKLKEILIKKPGYNPASINFSVERDRNSGSVRLRFKFAREKVNRGIRFLGNAHVIRGNFARKWKPALVDVIC